MKQKTPVCTQSWQACPESGVNSLGSQVNDISKKLFQIICHPSGGCRIINNILDRIYF
jgi:hypothetical protein